MQPVIEAAASKKMGITVMNPLAGGIIPQNESVFSKIKLKTDENIAQSTLRFIYSNIEITSILSGISSKKELIENVNALSSNKYIGKERIELVQKRVMEIKDICTGCGYCKEVCPKKIPIPEFMQSYNMSFLNVAQELYGRKDINLIKRIGFLRKLSMDFQIELEKSENICIKCKKCEEV